MTPFQRLSSPSFSALLLLSLPLLSACAAGPDFEKPSAPETKAYSPLGNPSKTASSESKDGIEQNFKEGADIKADWWSLFHAHSLDTLIARALDKNPDLQAAEAALREANENVAAGQGGFFPSVSGNAAATRQKASGGTAHQVYNTSVSVSYVFDVFGGVSREVEGLEAQRDFQKFQLEATHLTLTSNVVTAAITEASLRAQIDATQNILKSEKKQLELLNRQLELGGIAKTAVLAQAAQVAQTEATIPSLEKGLGQTRNQITALTGHFPSDKIEETFDLKDLHLPAELPLSLPSQLIEQRPDIQAATAQLHAASAAVGVATANMLPKFTITAGYGVSAAVLSSLMSPGSAVWSLGAGLVQPLFEGGTLRHQKRAADAAFDKATAQYRSVVIKALQDVADTLQALQSDADALKAQTVATKATNDSLKLAQEQYKAGAISYLSLLNAEQADQQAQLTLVQAKARRYTDSAALYVALGGGWWNRPVDAAKEKTLAAPFDPMIP